MDFDIETEDGVYENTRLGKLAKLANESLRINEFTSENGDIPFIVEPATIYPEIRWLSGLVNKTRFVAGGCFRDIFRKQKDKIRDIDLWHFSRPDWEHTVYHFNRSVDFEQKYETLNAVGYTHIPTGMVVEAIGRSFGTPDTILAEFDFSITKFALFMDDMGDLKTSRHLQYFLDLYKGRLSIHRNYKIDPDKLFNRIVKYTNYGFVPNWNLKNRLFEEIKTMKANEEISEIHKMSLY